MKKIILFGLIIILLITTVNATDTLTELENIAEELEMPTNFETVREINQYVSYHIQYKYYHYPRGINLAWSHKQGDCTDIAMTVAYMSRSLGIETRIVHGTRDSYYFNDGWVMHDWVEFKNEAGEWDNVERLYSKVKYTTPGFWGQRYIHRLKEGLKF